MLLCSIGEGWQKLNKFKELRSYKASPYIANMEGNEIPQELSFSIGQ